MGYDRRLAAMNAVDSEEFTAFVVARSPALLRVAYLLTGNERAAEDLLQSALLATLRHWGRIRDRDSLDAFVRRVMVNERRAWFRRRTSGEVVSADVVDVPISDVVERLGDVDVVRRALLDLPRRQRAVVVLRYFDDLPEAEVARILGTSVGTVKSQTSKALVKLRLALGQPTIERCDA
jgi:RNA polymerase sigma-70 factor (sigma-E family)